MSQSITLENRIVQKAMMDEVFKSELLSNPIAAIKKAFDVKLPEGFKLNVVEEKRNELYVKVPCAIIGEEKASAVW